MDQKQVATGAAATPAVQAATKKRSKKTTAGENGAGSNKRARLLNMVFYDGRKNPASVLHELRPDVTPQSYTFEHQVDPAGKGNSGRFHCRVSVDTLDPQLGVVNGIGVGRNKQLAKNMAAQQVLMVLYPTYRPPAEAILCETSSNVLTPFVASRPASLHNDPSSLLEKMRKHLTTQSIATKSPVQLFQELFLINGGVNKVAGNTNKLELIGNDENLVLVRATAMGQEFWSVSRSKSVAQNDACQMAIEHLCNVSFAQAKSEFIHALRAMNKIKLPLPPSTSAVNESATGNDAQQMEHDWKSASTMAQGVRG